jgi:transposase
MGKPYSIDLRERVQAEVESGQSRRSAARRYDVSPSFAVKLADRVWRTGSAKPARQGRPPGGGKLAPHLPTLLDWVETWPDITMPELAAKLYASGEGRLVLVTVWVEDRPYGCPYVQTCIRTS